jgi:hypothetical protein
METGPSTSGPSTSPDIFDEFESYRFSDDPEFRVSSVPLDEVLMGRS